MNGTDKPRPFVVRDRRAFTREGERRTPDSKPDEAGAPASEPDPRPADPAPSPEAAAPDETSGPADDIRFRQLVNLLTMQAAILLNPRPGESAEASAARRSEAIEGLEATIGMLEALQQKTSGRLSEGDARFLSQALYELRMAYMGSTRPPAPEAKPGA